MSRGTSSLIVRLQKREREKIFRYVDEIRKKELSLRSFGSDSVANEKDWIQMPAFVCSTMRYKMEMEYERDNECRE